MGVCVVFESVGVCFLGSFVKSLKEYFVVELGVCFGGSFWEFLGV